MECDNSLSLMKQVLASDEIGRDEQSTLALLRKLDVRCSVYVHEMCHALCFLLLLIYIYRFWMKT